MWSTSATDEGVVQPFRFNFALNDTDGNADDTTTTPHSTDDQHLHPVDHSSLLPGQRIGPETLLSSLSFPSSLPVFVPLTSSFAPLRHVASGEGTSLAELTRRSDVVRREYEGGFKVWECAVDLIDFLSSPPPRSPPLLPPAVYARVLEVGCGHGFPGLFCLLEKDAAHVTFQDLNHEVLTHCCVPNVHANLARAASSPSAAFRALRARCDFVSGDWAHPSLLALLPARAFTLIVTSDTLYEVSSIAPLLALLRHCLADDGVALVASKRFYFGVGGGTLELCRRVDESGDLVHRVERVLEDGHSNIREIISLRRARPGE